MPLAGINRVVIDLERRAEGQPTISASHEHYVGRAPSGRHHAGQHVNVVVGRSPGMINCQEQHSIQSVRIDSPKAEEATHVDLCDLVKSRCLVSKLRIARAHTIKVAESFTTDK